MAGYKEGDTFRLDNGLTLAFSNDDSTVWGTNQPNNYLGNQLCLALERDDLMPLHDVECSSSGLDLQSYICEYLLYY